MKIIKSTICFSLIIVGMAAIAVAQQSENGATNVRKLKSNSPERQDRPDLLIPEPIPAPQENGQVHTSNNLGISEPTATGGEEISPEPYRKGSSLCPTTTNCTRQGGLFKNRIKTYCWGSRHEVTPEMPFGASMNAAMKTQICNGLAAGMVLYRYDFCDTAPCDAHKLNIHGEKRLAELARRMQSCGMHPLVIESTPENPALEIARRDYVVKLLRDSNAALPDEWIVVGDSSVRGMSDAQAIGAAKRMYNELTAPTDTKNAQEVDSFGGSSSGGGFGSGQASGASSNK